jgi:ubiquinone/menaquinone biosynthesis C-methylase UbiE
MDPRVQRRVQRYGWDRAACDYELLWQAQLAEAQAALMLATQPAAGECVLDVACGTGLVALAAARAVGTTGAVLGIDLSGHMIDAARQRAKAHELSNTSFARMDAEALELPDAGFDVVLCSLGLMYLPDVERALREMRRVLRPGGRLGLAVWGERSRCGWSAVFAIVDAEVASDVCPLFSRLGAEDALARLSAQSGFEDIVQRRIATTLCYADADRACEAAFVGGPVALAWSRFGAEVRSRVRQRYLDAIGPWRDGYGYRIPCEFVIVSAIASRTPLANARPGGYAQPRNRATERT